MNIVKKLTLRHLKENKGRTVITTAGIIVAVAMITAVFVGISSLLNVSGQLMRTSTGDYDFSVVASEENIEKLKQDNRINLVGVKCDPLANNLSDYCIPSNCNEENLYYSDVVVANDDYFKQFIVTDYEGKLPTNINEIAVEQSYIEGFNLGWKIGDKVKLDYGTYQERDSEFDGYQKESLNFKESSTRTVTVTAILHNNYPTLNTNVPIINGKGNYGDKQIAYAKLSNVTYNSSKTIDDIIDDCCSPNADRMPNYEYLACQGDISCIDTFANLFPIIIVVLIIIIVASVMLVYNAFSMSLTDRIRYLGMLASVGATKKQKRNSVYFEGAFLGLIAIPLGVFFGIIGIDITLNVVINRLISSGSLSGVRVDSFGSILSVPIWSIVAIVVFSVATIFISAFIPAKKSSKISPIDAIRQNNSIKLKSKSLKSSKIIRKVFGYEGEIANKNIKRNGKKSKLITFSITISIILFLSVNSFCSMFSQQSSFDHIGLYQIEVSAQYNKIDEFNEALSKVKNIDKNYVINYNNLTFQNESKYISEDYYTKYKDGFIIGMHIIDDQSFDLICKNNNINSRDYYNTKTSTMLVVNRVGDKSGDNPVLKDSVKGNKLSTNYMITSLCTEIGDAAVTSPNYIVGDFVKYEEDNPLFSLDKNEVITAFVPISQYIKVNNLSEEDVQLIYGIETEDHKSVMTDISDITGETGKLYVTDIQAGKEVTSSIVFSIQVFLYGFITLITLITIFNIINTISTGISMRKKEFAMLRSVGVSKKGFYKIVCLESVLYGVKALVVGLPISFLISYLMNKLLGSSAYPFTFDYMLYIIVIVAVFVIVGLSMFYAVNKIRKGSIIDALKEDVD